MEGEKWDPPTHILDVRGREYESEGVAERAGICFEAVRPATGAPFARAESEEGQGRG